MQKLGYGPDKRLNIKVSTRDLAFYRDPAILLIDQLKQVSIDGELDPVETANSFPKIRRKDFTVALTCKRAGRIPTRSSTCSMAAARASIGTATATRRSTR